MKAIEILNESARRFPDNPVLFDEAGILTYKALAQDANELASELKKKGLLPGMHAGLRLSDGRQFITYLFAASACGATVVPLAEALKADEYSYLIESLAIDILIHQPGIEAEGIDHEKLNSQAELTFFKAAMPKKFPGAAFIRPTSGTTGKAKGVVFSHEAIFERIENALAGLKVTPEDRILWVLPMAYHFIVSIILYVRAGAAVIIPKNRGAPDLCLAAEKCGATILYAGPLEMSELSAMPRSEMKLPSLRYAICTVGGISAELSKRFALRHGTPVRQVYGMIEIGLPLGDLLDEPAPVGSVGKVMPGFEIKLLKNDGAEAGIGELGEIAVCGPGMFDGYYNSGLSRDELLCGGFFKTGDIAVRSEDGDFYIKGRAGSIIELQDQTISCEEVENIINDHPAVRASRVYLNGRKLMADLEIKNGERITLEELKNHCNGRLESFKVPVDFSFKEKIDLTATGKVVRYKHDRQVGN